MVDFICEQLYDEQVSMVNYGTIGLLSCVRLVLQNGADVDARMLNDDFDAASAEQYASYPYGSTALHMVAVQGGENAALLKLLLEHGASVEARTEKEGFTALLIASTCSLPLTCCLLDAGASPLRKRSGGDCALQACIANCTLELVDYKSHGVLCRTDALHMARKQRNAGYGNAWPFTKGEVDVAPFIAAALLKQAYEMRGFKPKKHIGNAGVAMAVRTHGANAAVTRMARLANAGVPISWRRNNASAFPPAFRAVVRTLLMCLAHCARLHARAEPGGFVFDAPDVFDAIVALLARLDVWPTFPCGRRGRIVEHVSVFDFTVIW